MSRPERDLTPPAPRRKGLAERVAEAKASPRLKTAVGVQKSAKGYPTQTVCKVCGAPIAGLVVHETPLETTRRDGKVVVRERLVWAAFSNYGSVEIEFADGSKHMTPMCTDCIPRLDADTAEAAYLADVGELMDGKGGKSLDLARFDRETVRRWRRID